MAGKSIQRGTRTSAHNAATKGATLVVLRRRQVQSETNMFTNHNMPPNTTHLDTPEDLQKPTVNNNIVPSSKLLNTTSHLERFACNILPTTTSRKNVLGVDGPQ